MAESGYLGIEIETLQLNYLESKAGPQSYRIQYELVTSANDNTMLWKNDSKITNSNTFSSFSPPDESSNSAAVNSKINIVGVKSFERSKYADLTPTLITSVLNSYLVVKIINASTPIEAAAAAPAKGAKGAAVATGDKYYDDVCVIQLLNTY